MEQVTEQGGASSVASTWTVGDLIAEGLAALAGSDAGDSKLIEGRAIAIKASPIRGNSQHIVIGTATLPPGFSTRAHSHAAEEVVVVLKGSGFVDIAGSRYRLEQGTVILAPANLIHVTHSDPGPEPLVVLWFYAPPGAEARWVGASDNSRNAAGPVPSHGAGPKAHERHRDL
jgi:quercetin dioxygenase-like cupin family protein